MADPRLEPRSAIPDPNNIQPFVAPQYIDPLTGRPIGEIQPQQMLEQAYQTQPWAYDPRAYPAYREADAAKARQADMQMLGERLKIESSLQELTNKKWQRERETEQLRETRRYHDQQQGAWRRQVEAALAKKGQVAEWDVQGNLSNIKSKVDVEALNKRPMRSIDAKNLKDAALLTDKTFAAVESFKPQFGGSFISHYFLGDLENTLKKTFRSLEAATGTRGQTNFWQAMADLDNLIRHPIFGAAFTETEKAYWNATTVNPGDDPKTISENIKRRAALMDVAVVREARRLAVRHDPKEILEATGMSELPPSGFARPIGNLDQAQEQYEMARQRRGPASRVPLEEIERMTSGVRR